MTQTALATAAEVSRRTILAIETGETLPTEETATRIARTLQFPLAFFTARDLDAVPPEIVSFRSLSSLSARRRDSVLAAAAIAVELAEWIAARFDLPSADVPDLRELAPEEAARELRSTWRLGEAPISNMVHLLEAHGIRVFSLAEDCVEVDAFSFWRDGAPYVFLNTLKSGERGRFDAAHELAHLVLHRHADLRGREIESEADRFASTFLMPPDVVRAEAPLLPTLPNLLRLKGKWKTSVAAMAYRLRALGQLSEWQYREIMVQISVRGWRREEPYGIPRETSQLLSKVFAMLREDHTPRAKVAEELSIRVEDLDALIFGLVLLPAPHTPPSPSGSAPSTSGPRGRPTLVR